jgi:hypothetical protein
LGRKLGVFPEKNVSPKPEAKGKKPNLLGKKPNLLGGKRERENPTSVFL